ncbi:MAG: DUF4271 domain-containing protein [Alistipes sp.]|nr:DUF4271 domain-containing protein [Alistipes sp.]
MTGQEMTYDFAESAAAMFGEASERVFVQTAAETVETAAWQSVSDEPAFQLLAVVLLFCIALLLSHRYELRALISGLGRSFAEDFDSSRKLTPLTNGFFNIAALTGVVAITLVMVKYSMLWLPEEALRDIDPVWAVPAAAAAVLAAVSAVTLYEWTVIKAAGFIGGSRDFADTLLYVKRACFSLAALMLSPVILLSAPAAGHSRMWLYTIATECIILLLIFLKETLLLFVRKKIPIFQWFLYLCAVEAFPLTLICASIARLR